jgi:hypothetical protein
MALTADVFMKPEGLIEPRSMFPGESEEDLNARLDAYIDEGMARTTTLAAETRDSAVSAWVYHRAFLAVWIELSGNPASAAQADQGSTLYTQYQIQNFKDLSDQFLRQFEGYVTSGVPTNLPMSYSVRHRIAYN